MIDLAQLDALKRSETGAAAVGELVDLSDVAIAGTTAAERLESLLSQISNPYHYTVGKTTVHISFASGAAPLEDKLKAHFIALKQKAFREAENQNRPDS